MLNDFYSDFDTELYAEGYPRRNDDGWRTVFQVETDRVYFCDFFRRLQAKTQVFQAGAHDFYRNRLTHTIEVARIGRSLCEALNREHGTRIDANLVEAVCLAHDLGHPPFGHIGERKLNTLMAGHGGFEGNAQTLRILTHLFYADRDKGFVGMQPSRALLDGVIKYPLLRTEKPTTARENHFLYEEQAPERDFARPGISNSEKGPRPIECQIMDWADDTAYCLHDIEDGTRAGFINGDSIRRWREGRELDSEQQQWLDELSEAIAGEKLGAKLGRAVGRFIHAARLVEREPPQGIDSLRYGYDLEISGEMPRLAKLYKEIATDLLFRAPVMQQFEYNGGRLLACIFEALRGEYIEAGKGLQLLPPPFHRWVSAEEDPARRMRRLCDYVASLTDHEAVRMYKRTHDPEYDFMGSLV